MNNTLINRFFIPLAMAGLITSAIAAETPAPWPAPVKDFQAPAAGEHPRLLFRKADVAALRAKAQTPEGRKMVERLRATLGGGETLPKVESPLKVAYEGSANLPEGAWTISTPMGFGMLYQLTGERKYADLAYAAFERGWAGVLDRDKVGRYGFANAGGQLRTGPCFGWAAVAYDLCYDGWDDAKRAKVRDWLFQGKIPANSIQQGKRKDGASIGLQELIERPAHGPASNHHGAIIGGAGLAVLALQGDPGVDMEKITAWNAKLREGTRAALTAGFGDHGFFAEGQGPSHVAANSALLTYLQALRVAAGEDWTGPDTPGAWLTLRWVMETAAGPDGTALYPVRDELFGAAYGSQRWLQMNGSVTHGGWFSQGFGALSKEDRPLLLWTYNHVAAKDDDHGYDSLNYPHRAALALINWPLETPEANPATRMPRVIADKLHGYYVLRSAWKDNTDVIATVYSCRGPRPYGKWPATPPRLMANGIMQTVSWTATTADPTVFRWDERGGAIAFSNGFSAGVFPGTAANCDAVMVRVGVSPDNGAPNGEGFDQKVTLGGKMVAVFTISATGKHPKAVVEGNAVRLGGLLARIEDGVPVFQVDGKSGGEIIDAYEVKKLPRPNSVKSEDIVLPTDASLAFSFDPATLVSKDGRFYANPSVGPVGQAAQLYDLEVVPGILGTAVHSIKGTGFIPSGPEHGFGPKGLSVSMWFKLDEPIDGYGLILENSPGWNGDGKYQIGWHPGPVLCFGGAGNFDVPFGNEADRWYHLCAVVDAKQGQLMCYLDGQLLYRGKASAALNVEDLPLFLFGRGSGENEVGRIGLPMVMDELRFYQRPLSQGEILALYREGTNATTKAYPPIARFTTDKPDSLAGRKITFDAKGSMDASGGAAEYAWDFGDGKTATTGAEASHAYEKDGIYSVILTVRDKVGATASASQIVRIGNRPPIARLDLFRPKRGANKTDGAETVTFDAGGSEDPECEPLTLAWDPKPMTTDGMTATYAKPSKGALRVVVTVSDPQGAKSVAQRRITMPEEDGLLAATVVPDAIPGLHAHTGTGSAGGRNWKESPGDVEKALKLTQWTTTADLDWRNVAQKTVGSAQVWYGYIDVPASGKWTFDLAACQGAALWVDGNFVVGNYTWMQGTYTCYSNSVGLAKGLHPFRFAHWATGAGLAPYPYFFSILRWNGPGVETRTLNAGDFKRSLSPWERSAAGHSPAPGEDLSECWTIPIPSGVTSITAKAEPVPGSDQPMTRLSVEAPANATVVWHTAQGHPRNGATVTVPSPQFPAVASVHVTKADGTIAIGRVSYQAPNMPARRSIGLKTTTFEFLVHEKAGYPVQQFWNVRGNEDKPIYGLAKIGSKLLDNHGQPTTCSLTELIAPYGSTPNRNVAHGTDGLFMALGGQVYRVKFSGIPYAKYEVRVYWMGGCFNNAIKVGKPEDDPVTIIKCADKTVKIQFTVNKLAYEGAYVVVNDGEQGRGNIARFRDLGVPEIVITALPPKRGWIGIAAIQIVETP